MPAAWAKAITRQAGGISEIIKFEISRLPFG
jgi:hypothetical protein